VTSIDLLKSVSVNENIPYCKRDEIDLRGDLYLPAGEGPFPVLIGVPGGGWRSCTRTTFRPWGLHLAARGYGLFVIDYRVATATRKAFPESLQDVVAAIQFIRVSGPTLSIDPARIGLIGPSAGAHLAALVAFADDKAALGGWSPGDELTTAQAAVKALVLVCGIYDLYKYWQDNLGRNPDSQNNISRNLIGKDPYECQRAYFEASPLRHVGYRRNRVPILLSWSAADEMVDSDQAESLLRALQQARFSVRTHKLLDASHFWFAESPDVLSSHSAMFAPRLVQFLDSVL